MLNLVYLDGQTFTFVLQMAASHAGYQFLKKAKLLEYLVGLMKNEDGAESSLSVCAAIKFFGRLSSIEVSCRLSQVGNTGCILTKDFRV